MPKRLLRGIAVLMTVGLLVALLSVPAAARSDNATAVYRLAMSGAEEVCDPPNLCGGDGTGEAILIVNPNTDRVCFLARWRNVDGDILAGHIHEAPEGSAGDIVVPLFVDVSLEGDDMIRGCVDGAGFTELINADPSAYYVNIHSTTFPAGALRAQLG